MDIPTKSETEKAGGLWGLVHGLAVENLKLGGAAITDEDDLNHRVLVTFPVWLKAKLAEAMLTTVLEVAGDESGKVLRAFDEKTGVDTRSSQKVCGRGWSKRIKPKSWPCDSVPPVRPGDLLQRKNAVRAHAMD